MSGSGWLIFIGEAIRDSYQIVRGNLRTALIVNSLFFLVLICVYTAAVFAARQLAYDREYQNILLNLIAMPVTAWMLAGLIRFYTEFTREGSSKISLLFLGYRNYFYFLLFCFIYYFFYLTLLKFALFTENEDYSLIFKIRTAAGIPIFIWTLNRLVFSPMYLREKKTSIRFAFKSSFLLTSTRSWRTLALTLVLSLILAAGLAALGIGAVFTLALVMTAYVRAFDFHVKAAEDKKKEK